MAQTIIIMDNLTRLDNLYNISNKGLLKPFKYGMPSREEVRCTHGRGLMIEVPRRTLKLKESF
jgi:hypothetical protein